MEIDCEEREEVSLAAGQWIPSFFYSNGSRVVRTLEKRYRNGGLVPTIIRAMK